MPDFMKDGRLPTLGAPMARTSFTARSETAAIPGRSAPPVATLDRSTPGGSAGFTPEATGARAATGWGGTAGGRAAAVLDPALPPVALPRGLVLEAFAHARECYPEECCGLLIGPAGAP